MRARRSWATAAWPSSSMCSASASAPECWPKGREQARAAEEKKAHAGIEQQRLLLFRAGSFERLAVPLSLVARLEEFPRSSIEFAGGCQVVQYRNRILPLVPLREVLESAALRR